MTMSAERTRRRPGDAVVRAALAKGLLGGRMCGRDRWQDADGDARQHRNDQRKQHDHDAGAGLGQPREIRGRERDQRLIDPNVTPSPTSPPASGQQETLDKHLLNQPPARRAERRPERKVVAAPARPREEDVGDVDAGDEEQDPDASEEDEQRRAHRADGLIVQRSHRHAPSLIGVRESAGASGGDRGQLGARAGRSTRRV